MIIHTDRRIWDRDLPANVARVLDSPACKRGGNLARCMGVERVDVTWAEREERRILISNTSLALELRRAGKEKR